MLLLLNVLNTGSERTEFTYCAVCSYPVLRFFLLHRNLRQVSDLQTEECRRLSVIRSLAYNALYQHYVRIIRLQTRHGENVLTADCPCHNASKAHLREYMSRRTVQSVICITA